MANKQIASYIVDLAPTMGSEVRQDGEFAGCTDLEVAVEYLNREMSKRVIKGRKTDYIQVYVTLFSPEANGSVTEVAAADDPLFCSADVAQKLVATAKVVGLKAPPKVDDFWTVSRLRANGSDDVRPVDGRLWVSILKSINDVATFVGRRKFPRKRVELFTNLKDARDVVMFDESNVQMAALRSAIQTSLADEDVVLRIYDVGLANGSENVRKLLLRGWTGFVAASPGHVELCTAHDMFRELGCPRVKPVQPARVFRGDLRLGHDPVETLKQHFGGQAVRGTGGSGGSADTLSFEVEGYPAAKAVPHSTRSVFLKTLLDRPDGTDLGAYEVKRITEKYIMQQRSPDDVEKIRAEKRRRALARNSSAPPDDGRDIDVDIDLYQPVPVPPSDIDKAYRYASDFVPLSAALETVRKYRAAPGLDFRGVIKLRRLPPWFLLSEPVFVVAAPSSSWKNKIGLTALVKALLELDSAIVARYVRKEDAPVQMAALIPVVVGDTRKRPRDAADGAKYLLVLARLPFAEDEKVSYFTDLDHLVTRSGSVLTAHQSLLPDDQMLASMKNYIVSMDMDHGAIKNSPSDTKLSSAFHPRESSLSDSLLLHFDQASHSINFLMDHVVFNAAKQGISTAKYTQLLNPASLKDSLSTTERAFLQNLKKPSLRNPSSTENAKPHLDKLIELLQVSYIQDKDKLSEKTDDEDDIEFLGDFDEDDVVDLDQLLNLS